MRVGGAVSASTAGMAAKIFEKLQSERIRRVLAFYKDGINAAILPAAYKDEYGEALRYEGQLTAMLSTIKGVRCVPVGLVVGVILEEFIDRRGPAPYAGHAASSRTSTTSDIDGIDDDDDDDDDDEVERQYEDDEDKVLPAPTKKRPAPLLSSALESAAAPVSEVEVLSFAELMRRKKAKQGPSGGSSALDSPLPSVKQAAEGKRSAAGAGAAATGPERAAEQRPPAPAPRPSTPDFD
jgi:hypothetical protein